MSLVRHSWTRTGWNFFLPSTAWTQGTRGQHRGERARDPRRGPWEAAVAVASDSCHASISATTLPRLEPLDSHEPTWGAKGQTGRRLCVRTG